MQLCNTRYVLLIELDEIQLQIIQSISMSQNMFKEIKIFI